MALFYSLTQATTLTYALTCFYSFESTKPEEKGPRLKGLKVPADFKITILPGNSPFMMFLPSGAMQCAGSPLTQRGRNCHIERRAEMAKVQ